MADEHPPRRDQLGVRQRVRWHVDSQQHDHQLSLEQREAPSRGEGCQEKQEADQDDPGESARDRAADQDQEIRKAERERYQHVERVQIGAGLDDDVQKSPDPIGGGRRRGRSWFRGGALQSSSRDGRRELCQKGVHQPAWSIPSRDGRAGILEEALNPLA